MKATIYMVLSRECNGEIKVNNITFDYKKAIKVAKVIAKNFINESYDPEKFSLKDSYKSLKEDGEVYLDDLAEIIIEEKEIEFTESILEKIRRSYVICNS